jgi:phosphoglycolate phosphatase
MKIPLFDIDGTLLKAGNAVHDAAFDYAFKTVFNSATSKSEIATHGMTDTQIILELLLKHSFSEEEIKSKKDEAVRVMNEYFMQHENEEEYTPLAGVVETLHYLKEKNILMGLLTGNVEPIAWRKIEKAGIKDYFKFGAFGDAVYKRVELLKIAEERANKMGPNISISDFIIIGDTPLDVKCAKDGNIQVIAVASGVYTVEQLQEAGADFVLESLEDSEKILKILEI